MPVVVVTGASSGVGRATAIRFAKEGYDVGIVARGEAGIEGAAADVRAAGRRAVAVATDVADHDAVEAAAAAIEAALGPIDVWVNAAMACVLAPFWDVTPEEFHRTTDVMYHGYVHGTMAALRRMRPRDRGTIVQVGSVLAHRAIPDQAAYCGAKFAQRGFTESLRSDLRLAGSKVHITECHLSAVNTPHFRRVRNKLPERSRPVPPFYEPEVAAGAIHFAATHARRDVWVGLPAVVGILGGARVAPHLADFVVDRWGTWMQQTGTPLESRPDNLFAPMAGDPGARGPFRVTSKHSTQLWASEHRRPLLAAALVATGVAQVLRRRQV